MEELAIPGDLSQLEAQAAENLSPEALGYIRAGAGDRDALILETLLAFKRAGATGILTYHAVDAARLIAG